jgi:hypothetical protein
MVFRRIQSPIAFLCRRDKLTVAAASAKYKGMSESQREKMRWYLRQADLQPSAYALFLQDLRARNAFPEARSGGGQSQKRGYWLKLAAAEYRKQKHKSE